VRLADTALTIQVPNKFFYEWLEEHYIALLRQSIRKELGDKGRLEYQILLNQVQSAVNQEKMAMSHTHHSGAAATNVMGSMDATSIHNPMVIPGIRKPQHDSGLNTQYTFANFIEGDCNRLGRSAGVAVAQRPGASSFNPLMIFGDVGLGKTHLAQAIGNELLRHYPQKQVVYVTCEKFTNQLIDAIRNNEVPSFTAFYQGVDLLIVDDIQFLANKGKTQEIFFHIFNQLHQNGKQIVLTSDRPPKDLQGMEERLISRFKWGLSADLHAPDLETRMAILTARLRMDGIEISSEVLEFICYNIKNNVRELEGVFNSLVAQARLNRKEISVEVAREVIRNFVNQTSREVTIEYIQNLVCDHLQVGLDKVKGQTRKRSVVVARQLSMYLAKQHTDKSLKAIGDAFGGRDHSTVIYSVRTVQDLIDTDQIFRETVTDLEKKLRMSVAQGV
jgi:chromosomal replication initiator protein